MIPLRLTTPLDEALRQADAFEVSLILLGGALLAGGAMLWLFLENGWRRWHTPTKERTMLCAADPISRVESDAGLCTYVMTALYEGLDTVMDSVPLGMLNDPPYLREWIARITEEAIAAWTQRAHPLPDEVALTPDASRDLLGALTQCVKQLNQHIREGRASSEDREVYEHAKELLARLKEERLNR